MSAKEPKILLCDCEGSIALSGDALAGMCPASCGAASAHSSLCRLEVDQLAAAMQEGPVIVACAQEEEIFGEVAEDIGSAHYQGGVDLRDRALWSDEAAQAGPKVAALLAEATRPSRPAGTTDISSEGVCLVYGAGDAALQVAGALAPHLTVTAMLTGDAEIMTAGDRGFEILRGRIRRASGYFGAFELVADGVAAAIPGGRGAASFEPPRDGGKSTCDIIVDVSGGAPLFSAHGKRDGYLRADPADPVALARIVSEALPLTGTFEKPLYVNFHAELCAHSRSGQPGCTRCLDVCPTGAITPDGQTVKIDPMVCAGCGGCSAVCPSGAAEYALPLPDDARMRLETMLTAYRDAGGAAPRVLFHDEREGREMIAMAARFGRGLPAAVIPFAVNEVTQIGHDLMIAAFGIGAAEVFIHMPDRVRREGEHVPLEGQIALTQAMLTGAGLEPSRLRLVETDDPDALTEALYGAAPAALSHEPVSPLGDKRSATRLAIGALAPQAEPFPLPEGAPYGQVMVNSDTCTLCLACVSQCPVGALMDNPEKPQLRFRESACLQCGICENTCPEKAISLVARFDARDVARTPQVLHEDEPFPCVECGKLFGSGATVRRIIEKLGGSHWMFENPDRTRIIQMCDDCRVGAVFRESDNPFQMGEKPKVRTTEDYMPGSDGKPKYDA